MLDLKVPDEVKFDEDNDLDIDRGQQEGVILIGTFEMFTDELSEFHTQRDNILFRT